ncbi:MAG: hypothetical protein ACK5KM_12675 [Hyphomicrobiaceae bacterium]
MPSDHTTATPGRLSLANEIVPKDAASPKSLGPAGVTQELGGRG